MEHSVACELLESEALSKAHRKNVDSSFSDEDPSIDKDIDERYLVPAKPKENTNKGGGMSAKKLKDR
jgi:hypothetical protein